MKRILVFLLVVSSTEIYAQELWGISNSNYAGTMGHDLNPSSITGAPFRWELHLVSADISIMNNYMYLRRNSKAIRSGVRGDAVDDERFTDKFTTSDKSGFAGAYIKYPSVMYSTQKWGLGFHLATKTALSVDGVPYHLAKFMKEGFDYAPLQQIDFTGSDVLLAAANWHEAGITAGRALIDRQGSYLTAGATVNYLYGLNSVFLQLNSIDYNVRADSLWQIYMADFQYGYASADAGSSANDFLRNRGNGFSTSLGIQYYRNRNDVAFDPCLQDKKLKKYDYRIGFSLIDVGRIKFNDQAYRYDFNEVGSDWYGIDTVDFAGIQEADLIFNNQFYGLPSAALRGREYVLWMPAAMSMQFDYAYSPNIYFNLSLIQHLSLNELQVRRPDQLSVTARYETKRWEIAVPYSFYDYYRHRLGLAFRYGILTAGTDMIGPFTGLFDSYGFDFYIGIKWQFNPQCDGKPGKISGKNRGKNACFDKF